MEFSVLLFAGGLLFWIGLGFGQRGWSLSGGSLLLIPFAGMVTNGSIALAILPVLAGAVILAWALKTQRCPTHAYRVAAGLGYLLIVLALGFRQFPGMTPFPLLDVSGKQVLFPPEKLLLLALVPPLVLTPLRPDRWRWGREQPGKAFAVALPVTLLVLIPLALFLEHMRPGWINAPVPVLVYGLAYNFLFVCVLEESFFRGIVQTLCMRWARDWGGSSHADGWGLIVASLFFGGVHAGGGLTFVLLATLAGFAYGLVYYLTGRIDYAVFLHFAVNTVHHLVFAALPVAA